MIYRLALPNDADELAEMRWDFRLEEAPGATKHSKAEFLIACADFLRQGFTCGWSCWVAEDDANHLIVSHIFIFAIPKIPKPNALYENFGYVTNVYTRPAYRNQGIGTQLMAHVTAWAKQQNFENLIVWPSERSVPFYGRAGFVQDAEALSFEVRPSVL